MSTLNFPPSPIVGEVYTGPDGQQWVWDGSAWNSVNGPQGPTGPTGPAGGATGATGATGPTGPEGNKKKWSWGASSNSSNTTNRYLDRHDGVSTNESGYVSWYDCEINAISANTKTSGSWTAEVHINGVSAATLPVVGTGTTTSVLSVSVSVGDKISFYCNGTNIDKPSIDALFQEI